jgi:hypothetical protein
MFIRIMVLLNAFVFNKMNKASCIDSSRSQISRGRMNARGGTHLPQDMLCGGNGPYNAIVGLKGLCYYSSWLGQAWEVGEGIHRER